MDASASPKPGADNVYDFFMKFEGNSYPVPLHQKNTVVKYTKLPDFDFDARVSWPTQSYILQPRLRRVITLDDVLKTNRSLTSNFASHPKEMAASYTKRKFVTISEDDELGRNPGYFSVRKKITSPVKTANRTTGVDFKPEKEPPNKMYPRVTCATKSCTVRKKSPNQAKSPKRSAETDLKLQKQPSNRITSRLTNATKYTKETKTSAKPNNAYNKREVNVSQENYYKGKHLNNPPTENTKIKHVNEKVTQRNSKITQPPKASNISKNYIMPSESEKEFARIKNIFYDNLKTDFNCKTKPTEKAALSRPPLSSNKNKTNLKELKPKAVTVIRVPREDHHKMAQVTEITSGATDNSYLETVQKVNRANYTDDLVILKHVNIGTDQTNVIDQVTDMDDIRINKICKCESSVQTESFKEIFDSLEIPNVSLTKEKSESKETVKVNNTAVSNIKTPPQNISPVKDVTSSDISFCQGASYIISRATLTYTTRQKINFHILENDEEVSSNMPPSPLEYPINVMSVFKNELQNKEENVSTNNTSKKKVDPRDGHINHLNELNSPNCSYLFDKLMKPSDIISTIRVNNDLLQNDYICEQFQRELNFIDSFFESLQYLESCSLTDKCFPDSKVDSLVNNSMLFDSTFAVKNSEYDNFLSKLENGANVDDTETMASQSLCLLNLLIRDEQRRAKNLLFVLKMREDALKDFTKSQILWLEKKKKHDNTDISTLKKKQRGALLKLQHECGEMQRMRKALLTLSEKRKVALMKTKKNIELKLKNNVDVEQIILGKKKLKRIPSGDRNASPLKCFDLSSSGCDESTTSRLNSDTAVVPTSLTKVTSAEKCVQTGDTLNTSDLEDHGADITAENFVTVDGGYLNILFHDLALPQIFSSGKQYEVNEAELKHIVSTASNNCNNLSSSEVVDKLMDQIKNKEVETSSPSTARSLVEEFDQYYRGFLEDDKTAPDSPERQRECYVQNVIEVKDISVQSEPILEPVVESSSQDSTVISSCGENISNEDLIRVPNTASVLCECVPSSLNNECSRDKELVSQTSQTSGPLPVPVGAAAVESPPPDVPVWPPPKSTTSTASETDSLSSQPQNAGSSSVSSLATPVQSEAEELRRQQLAIEREIKALEQQQCRLLVVREIPDKPPPPYTPPTEAKPKPPRMFALDNAAESKIEKLYTDPQSVKGEEQDAFDSFLQDFCHESIERHKQEQSDKPWDACNLLPQKPVVDTQKQIQNAYIEIKEVLCSVSPSLVSGVSSRRSDHIDDILFTEWRRCEPDWTNLHTDEVFVKNQLFESIFQKILTETIDEYKKSVNTD